MTATVSTGTVTYFMVPDI